MLPEAFRWERFYAATVAKALRERGHLDVEHGRLTYQKRLFGMGRQRVYRTRPSISLNEGGYNGSRGYNPIKSFYYLGLPVPISEAGG